MQIIILGMHRSGTSLVARMVNMMGAYFAPEGMGLPPDEDNPKGYWERHDVIHHNDGILAAAGCAWNRLHAWPDMPAAPALQARQAMQKLVMGMDAFRPWMLKDPRLCITLPCWLPLLEVPVAVIVQRDPLECAISLRTRNRMPLECGLALWEYHAASALNASARLPRIFTRHADFLHKPVEAVQRLHKDLTEAGVQGLRLPSDREISAFAEPSLYRSRADTADLQALMPWHAPLAEMLAGNAPIPAAGVDISAWARQVMAKYKEHA